MKLSQNGLKISDTSNILEDVKKVFKAEFPDLNTDISTPQGQIIAAFSEMIAEQYMNTINITNYLQSGGDGVFLDIRNKTFFGIERKGREKGSVTALIRGLEGVAIPAGFKAKSGEHEFETRSSYTISKEGSVYVELFAVEDGVFMIAPNTLTKIITTKKGIDSITNPYASIPGQEVETDTAFRERAKGSIHYETNSIFSGTLAQIRQLKGVAKADGYENISRNDVLVKGQKISGNSINFIVKGGDLNDIGLLLLANKNPGCAVGGDIPIEVTDSISKQKYKFAIFRPQDAPLKAEIKVLINSQTSQDYGNKIKEQLINAVNALSFGSRVIPADLSNIIIFENLQVTDFKIGRINEEAVYTVTNLLFKEEAILLAENIKITAEQDDIIIER